MIWFIRNVNEYILNLFENMRTATLLHTAALPHTSAHCPAYYQTLPRALPHTATCTATLSRVHGRTLHKLPHIAACTATHCCAQCAHCMKWNAAHRTPYIAQPHTVACRNKHDFSFWNCIHLHEFAWICVNSFEFIWIKTILSECVCILW
jgi:hypothetical protein